MDSLQGASSISAKDVWRPLKRLGLSWTSALEVLLHPIPAVLVASTVGLIYFQASAHPDLLQRFPALGPLITTLSSIAAGLAGGFIEKRWSSMAEGGILVTRGKSAIRGLTLLLQNLGGLERRVAIYLERARSNKAEASITASYEEVIERCTALEEEAVNSIEEWQDIIPEAANVKTQIGIITALKKDLAEYSTRLTKLKDDLQEKQSRTEGERQALQNDLAELRSKFNATSERLTLAESKLASSPLSGLTGFQATGSSPFSLSPISFPDVLSKYRISGVETCPHCHEVQISPPSKTCRKCGKKMDGSGTGGESKSQ